MYMCIYIHTHTRHSKPANHRIRFLFINLFLRTPRTQLHYHCQAPAKGHICYFGFLKLSYLRGQSAWPHPFQWRSVKSSLPVCPFIHINPHIYIHFSSVARLKRRCNASVGCELKFRQRVTWTQTSHHSCAMGTCAGTPGAHPPSSGLAICSLPCSLCFPAHCSDTAWFLYKHSAWVKSPGRAGTMATGTTYVENNLCRRSEMGISCEGCTRSSLETTESVCNVRVWLKPAAVGDE